MQPFVLYPDFLDIRSCDAAVCSCCCLTASVHHGHVKAIRCQAEAKGQLSGATSWVGQLPLAAILQLDQIDQAHVSRAELPHPTKLPEGQLPLPLLQS